jgi:hypothetical protein
MTEQGAHDGVATITGLAAIGIGIGIGIDEEYSLDSQFGAQDGVAVWLAAIGIDEDEYLLDIQFLVLEVVDHGH